MRPDNARSHRRAGRFIGQNGFRMTAIRCWDCGRAADPAAVRVESVIHARTRAEGGPYRSWTCRRCRAENGVLVTGTEPWILIPLLGRSASRGAARLIEAFLSESERRRIERARAWWLRNGSEVDATLTARELPGPSSRPAPESGTSAVANAAVNTTVKTTAARRSPPPVPQRRRATSGPLAVLGLFEDATPAEIRRAWRALAKRWHPDRAAREGVSAAEASRRFREVRAAWERLRGT